VPSFRQYLDQAKIDFFEGKDFGSSSLARGIASLKNGVVFSVLLKNHSFTRGIDKTMIQTLNPISPNEIFLAECPTLEEASNEDLLSLFHKNLRLEIAERHLPDTSNKIYVRSTNPYSNFSPSIKNFDKTNIEFEVNSPKGTEAAVEQLTKMTISLLEESQTCGVLESFAETIQKIAQSNNGTFSGKEHLVKSEKSIKNKFLRLLRNAEHGSTIGKFPNLARNVDDLLRGTIVVNCDKDMANVITALVVSYPKARFDNKYMDAPYEGYVGIHAYIPIEYQNANGKMSVILAEVQIHTKEEIEIPERSHQAYDVARIAMQGSKEQKIGYLVDTILYCDAMISGMKLTREQGITFALQTRKEALESGILNQ
jgi:hypothetical protein